MVYRLPQPFSPGGPGESWLCYAAKEHPELAATSAAAAGSVELVFSYICNAFGNATVEQNQLFQPGGMALEGTASAPSGVRGYWFRFFRVAVSKQEVLLEHEQRAGQPASFKSDDAPPVAAAAPSTPPPPVPADWAAGHAEGSLLASVAAPDFRDQHATLVDSVPVGNGIVATVADLRWVYLGGVYNTFVNLTEYPNWRVNSSARASIPATTSSIAPAVPANISALDVRHGVYLARWFGLGLGGCLVAERRTYAPRIEAPLIVTELSFNSSCGAAVTVLLRTTFDSSDLATTPDLDVRLHRTDHPGTAGFVGTTRVGEPRCMGRWPGGSGEFTGQQRCQLADPSERSKVAAVYDVTPAELSVAPGQHTFSFITAYGSSYNQTAAPLEQAVALYAYARRLAGATDPSTGENGLYAVHSEGMEALWDVKRGGAAILATGVHLALARSAWTSLHALTASMSVAFGGSELAPAHAYSPGGLYSGESWVTAAIPGWRMSTAAARWAVLRWDPRARPPLQWVPRPRLCESPSTEGSGAPPVQRALWCLPPSS